MSKNRRKDNRKITTGGNFGKTENQTIILTPTQRFGLDLSDYITAIRNADLIDWPRRAKLIDMYEDISIDSHVKSVMTKYLASILSTPLQFQRGGEVDDRIQELIDSPWFGDLLVDFLMHPWKGVGGSLFQFYRDGKWLKYDLIDRKHVDAKNRLILRNQTDLHGQSWDEFNNLLYLGNYRQLGDFAVIAFWVIIRRNNIGDWLQLSEIFGRPITEATYDAWDEEARKKLVNDIANRGSLTSFIHPEGTTVKLIEAANLSGGANLNERLHVNCNSEISKAALGNTLSTEVSDKGTQALGEVQHEDQQDIMFFAKRNLLNILNYELTDIFQNLGFNTQGGKFVFVPKQQKDHTAQIDIDCKLKNEIGLPIGDDYFYEEYGIPKPDNYDELKAQQAKPVPPPLVEDPDGKENVEDDEDEDEKKPANKKEKSFKNGFGFFGEAPGKGALDW